MFEQHDLTIGVDLGVGAETARAWGTDLSAEYVRINAEYTT
jgi:glutamate N-acetyltransferase/amino-acid N-acetyltransferase